MAFLVTIYPTLIGVLATLIAGALLGFRLPFRVPRVAEALVTISLAVLAFAPPASIADALTPAIIWALRFTFGVAVALIPFWRPEPRPQPMRT